MSEPPVTLTFQQKRLINIRGKAYLGNYMKQGWSGTLPFYGLHCKKHGYYITYPQGYHQILPCPMCQQEGT